MWKVWDEPIVLRNLVGCGGAPEILMIIEESKQVLHFDDEVLRRVLH